MEIRRSASFVVNTKGGLIFKTLSSGPSVERRIRCSRRRSLRQDALAGAGVAGSRPPRGSAPNVEGGQGPGRTSYEGVHFLQPTQTSQRMSAHYPGPLLETLLLDDIDRQADGAGDGISPKVLKYAPIPVVKDSAISGVVTTAAMG